MASQIRYIPFIDLPENEGNLVSFELIPNVSRRGKTETVLKRMTIEGHICAQGSTDAERRQNLTERIEGIRDGFDSDYGDLGLYINGALTPHALLTTHPDNLSGTRVVYRSWPSGAPAEYANRRYYRVTLAALFRPNNADQIIAFRERLLFTGTAGPIFRYGRRLVGLWRKWPLYTNSTQRLLQSGEIWGLEGYPAGVLPGPIIPGEEHEELRTEQLIGGMQVGQHFLEYGIHYSYSMETNTPSSGLTPNLY